MKSKSIHFILLLLFIISSGTLKAQTAVLASGGNATGNGLSSYSIGQIDYLHNGSNAQVMEGVQSAYEVFSLSTGESVTAKDGILLYPNPFKDFLYLDFTNNSYNNSTYDLFDAQGKLIQQGKILQSKSELNFSSLPSTMYIIKINQDGKNLKTFKIIKK